MNRRGTYYVYMLRCADGTYYTGSTKNLQNRLKLHNTGNGAKYVRGKGPLRLVYVKRYRYYKNSLRAERRLKQQTKKHKEKLVKAF